MSKCQPTKKNPIQIKSFQFLLKFDSTFYEELAKIVPKMFQKPKFDLPNYVDNNNKWNFLKGYRSTFKQVTKNRAFCSMIWREWNLIEKLARNSEENRVSNQTDEIDATGDTPWTTVGKNIASMCQSLYDRINTIFKDIKQDDINAENEILAKANPEEALEVDYDAEVDTEETSVDDSEKANESLLENIQLFQEPRGNVLRNKLVLHSCFNSKVLDLLGPLIEKYNRTVKKRSFGGITIDDAPTCANIADLLALEWMQALKEDQQLSKSNYIPSNSRDRKVNTVNKFFAKLKKDPLKRIDLSKHEFTSASGEILKSKLKVRERTQIMARALSMRSSDVPSELSTHGRMETLEFFV
jgi:hypothetical protein